VTDTDLIESLDRHFMAGCPALSSGQLSEHEASGACRECTARAREAAELGIPAMTGTGAEGKR
jgi:hypothetical protein